MLFAYKTIRFSHDGAHFSIRAAEFTIKMAIRSVFFSNKIYSGKINNYMKTLCRNDIFSLKIKPVFHMISIYVSLNELFYKRSCFNADADISISNQLQISLELKIDISNAVIGLSNTIFCNKMLLP